METKCCFPILNIKQDPDDETDRNMEIQTLMPVENMKQETEYKDQKVKMEGNREEESDVSAVSKRVLTNSPSLPGPESDSFLYCEKCHQKFEGSCPEHGPVIYIDKDEDQKVKMEGNREEESDVSAVSKRVLTNSPSLPCPDSEDSLYCEKCHQKFEGSCPEHGPVIYIDNDEAGQGDGCYQEINHHVVNNSNPGQVTKKAEALWPEDFMTHSDDYQGTDLRTCKRKHIGEKSYKCDECSANISIKGHQETHTREKPYKCDMCGRGFSEWDTLKKHMRNHAGEKAYKCTICGASFTQHSNLKDHRRKHTGEKPYKCDVCGVSLTRCDYLIEHKRKHTGEKPYKCDVCGTCFTRHGSFIKHKRIHTGEKPYKCDVCGASFRQNGHLLEHKRMHTGEKPYKCDVCGASFARCDNLLQHKRIHTGEKPYKCDVCGASFTQNPNLLQHKRIHTGEKPYKCDMCGASFTQHTNLLQHKRIHTGERPYKCDVCGANFSYSGSLAKHKKTHAREDLHVHKSN